MANYCLIYKHQLQLHHHYTQRLREKMTNDFAGQSCLLKGSPPNYFNTLRNESKSSAKGKNLIIHEDKIFEQPL